MNIVKPYARLMPLIAECHAMPEDGSFMHFSQNDGINLLRRIEWCGRISHRSEDSQTDDSWQRFIKAVVIDKGDWSITEHAGVSVDWLSDRGVTHELVRHRLFSFTQESTRFVNYEKKMPPSFILPEGLEECDVPYQAWCAAINHAEAYYRDMVTLGKVAPQIARSVFPHALASRVIITGNLRNWRHFLIMRTTRESHPQMREITIPLLEEFKEKIPMLFDDIEPMQSQAAAIVRAR